MAAVSPPGRVFMGIKKKDYLGKNRTLMKTAPLQAAPLSFAFFVLVYRRFKKSVKLYENSSGPGGLVD